MENNNADEKNIPKLLSGKLSPSFPFAGIYRVPFAKVMQIPADDFFLQIKDKYTRHEKSLWMKFDAAFIKLPKGFE